MMKPKLIGAITVLMLATACSGGSDSSPDFQAGTPAATPNPANPVPTGGAPGAQAGCRFIEQGFGPSGSVRLKAEKVITGLEVPWAIGFLPNGDFLVTERPGRVRRVTSGSTLVSAPVLELSVGEQGEGGLLGLAIDPQFSSNRFLYLYYTASEGGQEFNRVARYRMSEDLSQAQLDRVLVDRIPAGPLHNGGRIHFGPDGMLYVGTGDARNPENAQNPSTNAGKILRVSPDTGSAEPFVIGIRNTQGFDWLNDSTLVVSDHGPTGELGLTGLDEVSIAHQGDNLGWPRITGCQEQTGLVTPIISWKQAMPPGGAIVYRGNALPSFRDSILVTSLGSTQMQRITLDGKNEVYLSGANGFGRLRDIVTGPDGALWITTSNCDGRGSCGSEKDLILRVTEGG